MVVAANLPAERAEDSYQVHELGITAGIVEDSRTLADNFPNEIYHQCDSGGEGAPGAKSSCGFASLS